MEFQLMQVSELYGVALNYAVARAVDYKVALCEQESDEAEWIVMGRTDMYLTRDPKEFCVWSPCSDWSQAGPLVERFKIEITPPGDNDFWEASCADDIYYHKSKSALEAICRAIAFKAPGSNIEIPQDLVGLEF